MGGELEDFDAYTAANEMEQDYEAGASSMHDEHGALDLHGIETPFPVATSEPILENDTNDMRQDGRKNQVFDLVETDKRMLPCLLDILFDSYNINNIIITIVLNNEINKWPKKNRR